MYISRLFIQEQSSRRKFEIKSCSIFFFIPKIGQHGFWAVQVKTNFFVGFCSVLAFLQAKKHILFQVQPLKMLSKFKKMVHFKVTAKIFGGDQGKKTKLRHEILELGSYNNLAQQVLHFFQFHSTLVCSRGEWFFREKKTCTRQVVPNCVRIPIPKFLFEMLLFNLAQGLRIFLLHQKKHFVKPVSGGNVLFKLCKNLKLRETKNLILMFFLSTNKKHFSPFWGLQNV